jgi:hypothetical protein
MKHLVAAILAGILLLFQVSASLAKDWLVERVSGTAWATSASHQRLQLKPHMTVAEGLTISTSQSGRVRLVSDGSSISLSPGSVAVVSSRGFFVRKTQVVQQVGMIEFDVEKRSRPYFFIETPYLAAVVKGTKFTVTVSNTSAALNVERGLVHVTDLASGESADVGRGQQAAARRGAAGLRTAGKTIPCITPGTPVAPSIAPPGRQLASFSAMRAERQSLGKDSDQEAGGGASGAGDGSGNGGGKGDGNGNGGTGKGGKGSEGGKGGEHGAGGTGDGHGGGGKGDGHGGGGKGDGHGGGGKGDGHGGGGKGDGHGGGGNGG